MIDVNIVVLDHFAPTGDFGLEEFVARGWRPHLLREMLVRETHLPRQVSKLSAVPVNRLHNRIRRARQKLRSRRACRKLRSRQARLIYR